MTTLGFVIALAICLVCAYVCARVARAKNRSPVLWGVLGFVFPVVSVVAIGLLDRRPAAGA